MAMRRGTPAAGGGGAAWSVSFFNINLSQIRGRGSAPERRQFRQKKYELHQTKLQPSLASFELASIFNRLCGHGAGAVKYDSSFRVPFGVFFEGATMRRPSAV